MLRNVDTIYYVARSTKNFSTEINFSENIFLVYRGSSLPPDGDSTSTPANVVPDSAPAGDERLESSDVPSNLRPLPGILFV